MKNSIASAALTFFVATICGYAQNVSAANKTYPCRAVGDSLTFGASNLATGLIGSYPEFLQQMNHCSTVTNEGVPGQTSTQIAVRVGALPTTATIADGIIPASGPVGISFAPGYEPVTTYSKVGLPMSVNGVPGVAAHVGLNDLFTRSIPGEPIASPPDSPVTILTNPVKDAFVIIWAGKNNANKPKQVVTDIAAIVASLPSPKKFVVLSVTNSDYTFQRVGGAQYQVYLDLNATLAATYPDNFIDIRTLLINAYDPNDAQDVIDKQHDVLPSSLRLTLESKLAATIPDATSCITVEPPHGVTSMKVDSEKIYISAWSNKTAAANGCIRGYANTVATAHVVGAPVTILDSTHLNPTGQLFVAKQIDAWMNSHRRQVEQGIATVGAVSHSSHAQILTAAMP